MNMIAGKTSRFISVLALTLLLVGLSSAQTARQPMLQDIAVQPSRTPVPSASPLVTKTGSSSPAVPHNNGARTLFPALSEVEIPGYSGILVESLDGKVVMESNADQAFNPASNVKIATAYAVLKTFGPDFRFSTGVFTDGTIDPSTRTLNGNLYVSGKDPIFGYDHGVALANELNKLGVSTVTGNLIVTTDFVMNYSGSSAVSGRTLLSTMDASKRSAAATKAWLNHLSYAGQWNQVQGTPSVEIKGSAFAQPIPSDLKMLFTHESAPMREILKVTLCYSNNFLAERFGEMLGGPYAVARVVQQNAGIDPSEFSIQTSSGLGINRVTPNAMMKVMRALRSDLARYKMTFADIMPVAGVDKGTLEERFDTDFARGSVVGKTGTLGRTDGGVSALSGEVNTKNGRLLFVLFNEHGGVARFRSFQNAFVSLVQGQFGGAVAMQYDAMSLETRLARSRIVYPASKTALAIGR